VAKKRRGKGIGIFAQSGSWRVRYRQDVRVKGVLRTRQPSVKICPIGTSKSKRPPRYVEDLAREILLERKSRKSSPDTTTTVGDFVDSCYIPCVERDKKASTSNGYKGIWERYLRSRCAAVWLKDVQTFHVQRWLDDIAREQEISRTTLSHIKHFLSGVFRYASQQGFRNTSNPATLASIPLSAPKAKEREAYTLEEIGAMLRILPEPAATVVETAAWTGLRASELRGLTWDCLTLSLDDESMAFLEVRRAIWRNHIGDPKTERSKAPVPVVPQLAARLAAHRRACGNSVSGPIFVNGRGNPMSLDFLYWQKMKTVLKKAGIPWKGWHGFRRGLASNLNRLGVDDSVIQAILRHSNVAVTQRCYIKTTSQDAVLAMRRLSKSMAEIKSVSHLMDVDPDQVVQ
jgi:integrase